MAERHSSGSEDESQKIETITISDSSEDSKSSSSEADANVSTSTSTTAASTPDVCSSTPLTNTSTDASPTTVPDVTSSFSDSKPAVQATAATVSAAMPDVLSSSAVSTSDGQTSTSEVTDSESDIAINHPILYRLLRNSSADRNPLLVRILRNLNTRMQNEDRTPRDYSWIYRLMTWDKEYPKLERRDMEKTLKRRRESGGDAPGPSRSDDEAPPAKKPLLESSATEAVTSSDSQPSTSGYCQETAKVPSASVSSLPESSGSDDSTQNRDSMVPEQHEVKTNMATSPNVLAKREVFSIISKFDYLLNTLSELEAAIERPDTFSDDTRADAAVAGPSCSTASDMEVWTSDEEQESTTKSDSAVIQENTIGTNSPDLNPEFDFSRPIQVSDLLPDLNELVTAALTLCVNRAESISTLCNAQGGRLIHRDISIRVTVILSTLNYLLGLREETYEQFTDCLNSNETAAITYLLQVIVQISQAYNRLLKIILTINDIICGKSKSSDDQRN